MDFSAGDQVRVLGPHGNTQHTGVVAGFTSRDRSHCSRSVKGRVEVVVEIEGVGKLAFPAGRVRRVRS